MVVRKVDFDPLAGWMYVDDPETLDTWTLCLFFSPTAQRWVRTRLDYFDSRYAW